VLFFEPKRTDLITACGGFLREEGEHPSVVHRGKRIYFCRKACYRVYLTDPERFMKGQIPHPLEEDDPANGPG
jgi:YHS domain-containing protein